MSVRSLLNDSCSIRRKTTTQSSTTGGNVHTWAKTASGVACTVQFDSGSESVTDGREAGIRAASVFFESGTDVRVTDRLSAFTLSPHSAFTMSVTSPPVDASGRGTYYMVTAENLEGRDGSGR